jgi:CRISPR/Cas system-associated endoribonuclease Cas2
MEVWGCKRHVCGVKRQGSALFNTLWRDLHDDATFGSRVANACGGSFAVHFCRPMFGLLRWMRSDVCCHQMQPPRLQYSVMKGRIERNALAEIEHRLSCVLHPERCAWIERVIREATSASSSPRTATFSAVNISSCRQ